MSSNYVIVFLVFLVVLAMIAGVAWLVRGFAGRRLGAGSGRGRMPRLAVIDATSVDNRRSLVLVRRDNIEHLVLIGGPNDLIVETNIVRAMPQRDQVPHRPGAAEAPPRIAPLPDTAWEGEPVRAEMFDHAEPVMPEPPPRPPRPSFADEARRRTPPPPPPPPPPMERPADPLAGFAPEPIGGRSEPRAEPLPPRMPRGEPMPRSENLPRSETMPRSEPMMPRPARSAEPPKAPIRERAPAPPPAPPPAPSADQNLAEMAQRLEAALRRPAGGDNVAPPVQPEAPPAARPSRSETPSPAPQKTSFENLEDEMASLLGRPKTPS
ncbi:MAG: flagellar biosynthesis protein FliO [Bradyrhizobium sp.]|uniref:flagellar biosynthetic protein FliO n=1 Tax=Bradyrhizobium sp. TaxID=376 RepID=UPI002A302443|nr:flagellar biosynthetic protein FliO [Bradyrhizobium sp.]